MFNEQGVSNCRYRIELNFYRNYFFIDWNNFRGWGGKISKNKKMRTTLFKDHHYFGFVAFYGPRPALEYFSIRPYSALFFYIPLFLIKSSTKCSLPLRRCPVGYCNIDMCVRFLDQVSCPIQLRWLIFILLTSPSQSL